MRFVLVHSPLVGTLTWSLVAEELRSRGHQVIAPNLVDNGAHPFWWQHVECVVSAVTGAPANEPIILAGHSAAGLLLPAIGTALEQPIAGYLFVDAGIPIDGLSRLEVIDREEPDIGSYFRELLTGEGRFPNWDEEALSESVPNPDLRAELARDLRPRGRSFFDEPIAVPDQWPEAPCGYLQFGPTYDRTVARIADQGWPIERIEAAHFHQLVDPADVVDAMLRLLGEMSARFPGKPAPL